MGELSLDDDSEGIGDCDGEGVVDIAGFCVGGNGNSTALSWTCKAALCAAKVAESRLLIDAEGRILVWVKRDSFDASKSESTLDSMELTTDGEEILTVSVCLSSSELSISSLSSESSSVSFSFIASILLFDKLCLDDSEVPGFALN